MMVRCFVVVMLTKIIDNLMLRQADWLLGCWNIPDDIDG